MNHSCVSWWTLLNSNYCIKPIFSVVRAARSSQTQLWSIPSGSRSKLELLCRLCWRLALSDNHFKERCSGKREAKQKSSRLWWMWPTGRHVKLVGSRKQQGRPGGCHMVSLSFGAWSSGAVSFNISQPLICSGSLLPYSYSRFGLFINDLPTLCQRNPPLGPRRQQVGPAVLGQASASAPQPDQRDESVRRRILLSSLKQAAHIAASRNQEHVLCCSTRDLVAMTNKAN